MSEVLKTHPIYGNRITKHYDIDGKLSNSHRNKLAELLVTVELNKNTENRYLILIIFLYHFTFHVLML